MNDPNSDHISTITQTHDSIKTTEVSISKDEADLKPVTKTIQKDTTIKRNYINTTNEQRLELIEAVCKHGERVKSAAKRLQINYSAAKAICQVYKSEGRSMKKPPRRKLSNMYKMKDNSLFKCCDNNTDSLKFVPITTKKEYTGETDKNRSFMNEKALQLLKKPLVQCFPEAQRPLNKFDSLLISQNLLQNPGICVEPPSITQQSRLPIIGLPVISSQIYTSNIFVMLPQQIQYNPLYNTMPQCNNFQLSSLSPSISSYRFLF